jgi:UDPglucose 6-dehydrogenase
VAARGAHILVVATEWPDYRNLQWVRLAGLMARREVFDARAIVDVEAALAAGFRIRSLERSPRGGGSAERRATRDAA